MFSIIIYYTGMFRTTEARVAVGSSIVVNWTTWQHTQTGNGFIGWNVAASAQCVTTLSCSGILVWVSLKQILYCQSSVEQKPIFCDLTGARSETGEHLPKQQTITRELVWSGKIWGGRCPEQTQQRCYPWLDTKNEWHKPGSHGLMSSWSVTRSITSDHFQFSKQTLLITGHDKSAEVNLKEDWSRGAGSPGHNICLGTVSGHSSGDQVWPGYNYGSASLLSLSTGSTINSHFSSVFSHKWHKQQWSQ